MANDDPFLRLKLAVGYVIVVVWGILFLAAIVSPPRSQILYISVQGAMTIVAGGLFATRFWRKNGNGNGDR